MQFQELIKLTRTAIVQVVLSDVQGNYLSSGTGFVSGNHFISNNHVFFDDQNRTLADAIITIKFDDPKSDEVKLNYDEIMSEVEAGSDRYDKDYIIFRKDRLGLKQEGLVLSKDQVKVGQEIAFLGFPFGLRRTTAHHGYVSAVYEENGKSKIQVDASVNPGNSGGPLFDLSSGKVIGIITRSIRGLTEDFDKLIDSYNKNVQALEAAGKSGGIKIMGIDPFEVFSVSQRQMAIVTKNLKRTANVGIGIGYSIEPVIEELDFLDNPDNI